MAQAVRTTKASPARWQRALRRAFDEGVAVAQVSGSGMWVATSGTKKGTAYQLSVTNGVVWGCDCLAGLNNDPCCKHRAAYWHRQGLLDLDDDPEPTPAAAVAA